MNKKYFMLIENKMEKMLLSLAGFFLLALIAMGFKIQNDSKKIALLTTELVPDMQADPGLAAQDAIKNNRDSKLNAAAHAPLTNSNTQTTIKTVIPGKTITQIVPATSSSTSSSSTKKTKTS